MLLCKKFCAKQYILCFNLIIIKTRLIYPINCLDTHTQRTFQSYRVHWDGMS